MFFREARLRAFSLWGLSRWLCSALAGMAGCDGTLHNAGMDATGSTLPTAKSTRLRRWLARRWVAIVVATFLFVVIGRKNDYQYLGPVSGISYSGVSNEGTYGWPRPFVVRIDQTGVDVEGTFVSEASVSYRFESWSGLFIDLADLIGLPLIALFVVNYTQRHCNRWNQFSLATLLVLTALVGIVCMIW